MKPVAPKDTPDVGGGISGPWSDPPEIIPIIPPPPSPWIDPLVNDPTNPTPDLT